MPYQIVERVINGNTFEIDDSVEYGGEWWTLVEISGADIPGMDEPGGKEAKDRLAELILDKLVDISPAGVSYNPPDKPLLCDVFLVGDDVQLLINSEETED